LLFLVKLASHAAALLLLVRNFKRTHLVTLLQQHQEMFLWDTQWKLALTVKSSLWSLSKAATS
jgi:hypothetical protein